MVRLDRFVAHLAWVETQICDDLQQLISIFVRGPGRDKVLIDGKLTVGYKHRIHCASQYKLVSHCWVCQIPCLVVVRRVARSLRQLDEQFTILF